MKSIFDETALKNRKVKNRIFRSATWMAMADRQGHISDDVVELYRSYAEGQVGGIITGSTSIYSKNQLISQMMAFHDDSYLDEHVKITDAVHEHGSLIFLQAIVTDFFINGSYDTVNSLNAEDIDDIVDAFVDASLRAKKAGYDGIQIHAAHFFFLSKFISPLVNRRSDEYGGSNKNRAKILVRIIQAIKSSVDDFLIIIKINGSDFEEGGLEKEDFIEVCMEIDKAGIDAIEVSGNNTSRPRIIDTYNEAYFLEYGDALSKKVSCPIILVGGHRSIENMNDILNKTDIEYLSLSRPLICEPNLVKRWVDGDVRPSECRSCNMCYQTPNHECFVKLNQV